MQQNKIFALYGMNGFYYDAIMNSCPDWVFSDQEFSDWFCSQIGM